MTLMPNRSLRRRTSPSVAPARSFGEPGVEALSDRLGEHDHVAGHVEAPISHVGEQQVAGVACAQRLEGEQPASAAG